MREYDQKFADWNIHHKGLPCFHDHVTEHAIKSFIASRLILQRKEIREMVENLSMHENDEYDNGCEKAKSDVLNALDKI